MLVLASESVLVRLYVRVQITSVGYRTKHGQAIHTEFIEGFTHIEHVQAGKTNYHMNSVRIA